LTEIPRTFDLTIDVLYFLVLFIYLFIYLLVNPPADLEGTEMCKEGHAVVHLDASILYRIKQERSECDEAPQPECVLIQRQMNENLFETMLPNYATTADGHNGSDDATDTLLNEESFAEDSEGNVEQVAVNKGNPSAKTRSGLRRSSRQRFSVRRLSTEFKETESGSHQKQKTTARMHPGNSPRKSLSVVRGRSTSNANQQMLPNTSLEQAVCTELGTRVLIRDSSEVFKRRFRKVKFSKNIKLSVKRP